jgi:thiol-disulfide isomerase/thioredoxin
MTKMEEFEMRKPCILAGILFVSFLLIGCHPIQKISIDADFEVSTSTPIVASNLETMIASEADFVLLISSESCSSCQEFEPFIQEIIAEYQITVYQIEAGAAFPKGNAVVPYDFTPTFIVFVGGTVVSKIDAVAETDAFASVASFTEYLQKFVILE